MILVSNLITLLSENILYIILIFSKLVRLVLWPYTWSMLVNEPYALEKNIKFAVVRVIVLRPNILWRVDLE